MRENGKNGKNKSSKSRVISFRAKLFILIDKFGGGIKVFLKTKKHVLLFFVDKLIPGF